MIKSRGMKVSPSEVEGFLYAIDGVEAAAVVGIEHASVGEGLCAFITLGQGVSLSAEQVLERCRHGLETHKVPLSIVIESSLPRTANGKVDLQQLQHSARIGQRLVVG
nr:hypothetical protein [Pseudomonas sp. Hg5Tf]